jgi:hypothetical protein
VIDDQFLGTTQHITQESSCHRLHLSSQCVCSCFACCG